MDNIKPIGEKHVIWKIAILSVVFVAGWHSALWMIRPTELDFLNSTTSHFLKSMSDRELVNEIHYSDCRLVEADKFDKKQGIAKTGVCRRKLVDKTIHYEIALSRTARFIFSDFQETENK